MSDNINSIDQYLYANPYLNTTGVSPLNTVPSTDNDSYTDNSISSIGNDSVQISQSAFSSLNSSQGSNNIFDSVLNNLVTKGTITQDQANSINDAFISAKNSSQTYSNSPKGGSHSPLSSLVSNGTITQDQENSIKDALASTRKSSHHHFHGLNKQSQTDQNNSTSTDATNSNDSINTKLDSLVKCETITQDQENAIEQLINPSANDSTNLNQDQVTTG